MVLFYGRKRIIRKGKGEKLLLLKRSSFMIRITLVVKSHKDDSMLEERMPPLLFRAKEEQHQAENKISCGDIGGEHRG